MNYRKVLKSSINDQPGIDAFVKAKLSRLDRQGNDFSRLFELMFSEENNVMLEYSEGFRVREVTYGECKKSILERAQKLAALTGGSVCGDVIGLYMDNGRDWIECFWAIILPGKKPLLMNLRLDNASLENALRDTGAKCVIAAKNDSAFGVRVLTPADIDASHASLPTGRCAGEILFMSSGTTDRLKICAYDADCFAAMIEDSYHIIKTCPRVKRHYKGRMKLLTFLPFYHIFGLVAVYLWFAFFSRTFVLLDNMLPATILNTIRRHEVTHIFAVPLLWNKTYEQAIDTIYKRGEKTRRRFDTGMKIMKRLEGLPPVYRLFSRLLFGEIRMNLFGNSIIFMISGGSEIKSEVLSFFNAIGYHLANGYGMTEIGITSVELSQKPKLLNSGSVGQPLTSAEYKVEDGRLFMRGRTRAKSILSGGEWHKQDGGWFDTGDLAEYKNGRYYILGRRDDLVISPNGENLNPLMIEERLKADGIKELCLTSVRQAQDVKPVLIARAALPLKDGGLEKAKAALKERLAQTGLTTAVGQVVFVREALMGEDDIKLNRRKIARRFENGEFTVLTGEESEKELTGRLAQGVKTLFAEALNKPANDIDYTGDFFTDYGGTSLDYFAMVMKLQQKYAVTFPANAGSSLSTVRDISEFISERTENYD
ncbi:MAG: non-ribosomal peptide synthetase [Clostridia bacterium]|nr:non-ribosomal peptide synthetase [Clostridia bacterium]